jgi:hypothetical protein
MNKPTPADTEPWHVRDCEGELAIWRVGALLDVTRDSNGSITGYRLPASYGPGDLIAQWSLYTWDKGEDPGDDRIREIAAGIVRDHNERAALLAQVADLREKAARYIARIQELAPQRTEAVRWRRWAEGSMRLHSRMHRAAYTVLADAVVASGADRPYTLENAADAAARRIRELATDREQADGT